LSAQLAAWLKQTFEQSAANGCKEPTPEVSNFRSVRLQRGEFCKCATVGVAVRWENLSFMLGGAKDYAKVIEGRN
jgi:hypothetical protein